MVIILLLFSNGGTPYVVCEFFSNMANREAPFPELYYYRNLQATYAHTTKKKKNEKANVYALEQDNQAFDKLGVWVVITLCFSEIPP